MKNPIQPLERDKHGVIRFKENAIVRTLLDTGKLNLNDLAVMKFSKEDWEQFAQLIGYSLSGYGDLSYVSDETWNAADKMFKTGVTELEARNEALREELETIRNKLRDAVDFLHEFVHKGEY